MATIFVTGANGQLGSELQKISPKTSHSFIFTDIDKVDITKIEDLERFCNTLDIDYIINCAAYTAVDKAENEADKAFLINRDAVKNITRIANNKNAKLIHISTDYVFDGSKNTPYSETEKINPLSVYGKSKVEGEIEALKYDKTMIIRTAWLYSSFGNNIVKTIIKLSKERESLNFIFDQTGTPTYAGDLAEAILRIIDSTEKEGLKPGIYHYSNEGVCSWFDVAWEIVYYTKQNCIINPIETHQYKTPATRPQFSVLNKQKIKENFGLEIPYWRTSLHKCLNLLTN